MIDMLSSSHFEDFHKKIKSLNEITAGKFNSGLLALFHACVFVHYVFNTTHNNYIL